MIPERPSWMRQAACRDIPTEVFYPVPVPSTGAGRVRHDWAPALAVCETCTASTWCLDAGLDETFGVWGGTTPQQRIDIRRERRKQAG